MAGYSPPTADFVTTILNGAISSSATSMTIGTGLQLPATNGILQIDYDSTTAVGSDNGPETVSYTSYTTATGAITGLSRGIDPNTSGVAHANGATVQGGTSAEYWKQILFSSKTAVALDIAQFSLTSSQTTYTDVTGATITLTPVSANECIKVDFAGIVLNATAGNSTYAALLKDGTIVAESQHHSSNVNERGAVSLTYLDVQPTVAAHTYKVQIKSNAATNCTLINDGTGKGANLVGIRLDRI